MFNFKDFQLNFCHHINGNEQSDEFKELIVPIGELTSMRVLKVYKDDYFARLSEALGSTFETTWEVIGDDAFFKACEEYIMQNPSSFYSLGNYGEHFSSFLQREGYDSDIPFVSELAEFEWSFWKIFHSSFLPERISSQAIQVSMQEDLSFDFSPEMRIFSFKNSIGKLWKLREELGVHSVEDFLRKEFLLLGRSKLGVSITSLSEEEFLLVESLKKMKRWSKSTEDLYFLSSWSQEHWANFFSKISLFLIKP
jgi:hypothetical protein